MSFTFSEKHEHTYWVLKVKNQDLYFTSTVFGDERLAHACSFDSEEKANKFLIARKYQDKYEVLKVHSIASITYEVEA